MIRAITTSSPFSAFFAIMKHLNDHGIVMVSEDGDMCIESDTIIAHIDKPLEDIDRLVNTYCLGPQGVEYYCEQLCEGKHIKKDNPEDEAEYTYYGRLCDYDFPECYDHVNQIKNIVDKLKKSPNSRRAVAVTWQPWVDINSSDPPCMDLLKFSIRDGKLNLRVVFRSHDLLKGWPGNVCALSRMMSNIAFELNVSVGYLEVVSFDGHIYGKGDIDLFKSTLNKLGIKPVIKI